MSPRSRIVTLTVLSLGAALPTLVSAPLQARLAGDAAVYRYDPETLRSLGSIEGIAGTEFATIVSDRFVATAPAAAGGGALSFWNENGVQSTVSAADLSAAPTARMGEDWDDLGHPPGIVNAMVLGAPGEVPGAAAARAIRPAVLIVEYNNQRLTREARRVIGKGGSAFGWRVGVLDSQFPAASYFGSWVASAPLEGKGKSARTGAVYKYDTNSSRRLWRFVGERPGEMAGYALRVVPDADGDGSADVLVGAPGTVDRDPAGRLYLLSGADGTVIERIEAPDDAVLFGASVVRGSTIGVLNTTLVGAPGTPRGSKSAAGAVYSYDDLRGDPDVFRGKRRDQWFGVSIAVGLEHLFVGSFEGHRNAGKDRRGSLTALLASGKIAKVIRGENGGDHFGRDISIGAAIAVGAPGAPPLLFPE